MDGGGESLGLEKVSTFCMSYHGDSLVTGKCIAHSRVMNKSLLNEFISVVIG